MRRTGRAIRAINRRKQRIAPMRRGVLRLNAVDAQAESVAGEMAGAARASIGAEALEEHILAAFIDRTIGVVGGDHAGRIEERKEIGDNGRRSDRSKRQEPANQQPFSPSRYTSQETTVWPHLAS